MFDLHSVGGLPSTKLPCDVWINGFGGIAEPCIAIALRGFVVALLGRGECSTQIIASSKISRVQKDIQKEGL